MKMLKLMMLVFVSLCMPVHVLACDAAAENTHVGQLLSSNGDQFTIRDGQTGKPIQFKHQTTTHGVLPAPGSYVSVQYSKDKDSFIAEAIR